MKKKIRILAFALAAVLPFSITGCGGKKNAGADIDLSGETEPNNMPICSEPITIKWWTPLYGNVKSYNDNEMFKEMEKITGIHIEFVSPPKGQEEEQYGVMLASKDLPDIIERRGDEIYPGGIQRGVEDGFFLDLKDYINKYAPNVKNYMDTIPEYRDSLIMENGAIGSVIGLFSEPQPPWQGPAIRKDLLDKIHADIPRTPDELHDVLLKFKNELGVKYPMVLDESIRHIPGAGFTSGWDTNADVYYGRDEIYRFGPYEDSFGEMLDDLQQWYAEGLIDPEFAARDSKAIESAIVSGDVGFCVVSGDNVELYETIGKKSDPNYELEPIPFLVPERGKTALYPRFIMQDPGAAIVSTTKYPVECMKLIDFMFSKEGSEMCNYGVKGKTYTVDGDGVRRYTDFFTNNPDGIGQTDMMYSWARGYGAFYKEVQPGMSQAERDALSQNAWKTDIEYSPKAPSLQFSAEQMDENTTYWQDINTYSPKFITKYIMGMDDAGTWDEYKTQMKDFGMEKILKNFNDCAAAAKKK